VNQPTARAAYSERESFGWYCLQKKHIARCIKGNQSGCVDLAKKNRYINTSCLFLQYQSKTHSMCIVSKTTHPSTDDMASGIVAGDHGQWCPAQGIFVVNTACKVL